MRNKEHQLQVVAAGGLSLYLVREGHREVGEWTVVRKETGHDGAQHEYGRLAGLTSGEARQHIDRLLKQQRWAPAVVALETSAPVWDRYSHAMRLLAA